MPSPFPGMDPYLEKYWLDVHHRLVTYASDQLQERLPPDLRARVEERVFVETDEKGRRRIYPDVHIVEMPPAGHRPKVQGGVATAEPLVIHVESEPITQGYIEIIESGSGRRVVTLIEFLSPTNKVPGPGQALYLKKREEAIAARANVVEIDLTRAGERILFIPSDQIPPSHRTTYQVCAWRASRPDVCEVYRAPLEERLPAIRVPLRETDPDAPLELQALIDRSYQNGRHDDLEYGGDPLPPLAGHDATWASDLLRSKGRRP